ncbi:MAG: M48 family metalloprotease [Candidatus Bathyarchaeia archaeon]
MKWEGEVELRLRWLASALALLLVAAGLFGLELDPLLKFASTYAAILLSMPGASGIPLSLTWAVRGKLKRIGGGEALDLNALMGEAARNVGLRWRPEVGLIKSRAANAGATIMPYRVTVLSGLLEALTPSEIEAAFEHECSHLKRMHPLKIMAAHALPASALMLILPPQLIPLALTPLAILTAQLIVKRLEREADMNVKNKEALASALLKLQAYNKSLDKGVHHKLLSALKRLIMPHPPIEERVKALREASRRERK